MDAPQCQHATNNHESKTCRSFLLRDIYEEMALNGVPPDAFFLETAVEYCMRTSRVGDCFYFYNELLRRGMQPRARLKGHLVSVLARAGRIRAATDVSGGVLSTHWDKPVLHCWASYKVPLTR